MTDREMLVLAAKAAGIAYDPYETDEIGRNYSEGLGLWIWHWCDWFNPLTDDGDALRLAVKLNINIGFDGDALLVNGDIHAYNVDDRCTATRRAIVRAAAEIGKGIK